MLLISLLVFVIPGWHLVKIFTKIGIIQPPIGMGFLATIIPTLSISFSLMSLTIASLLHLTPELLLLVPGAFTLQVTAFYVARRPDLDVPRPGFRELIPFCIIVALPILAVFLTSYLVSPPSPLPFAEGWDVFSYTMLAGQVHSGILTAPLANLNPVTQQLPLPIGFPLFVALFLSTSIAQPDAVISFVKFGPIIPSTLAIAWVYLVAQKVSKNRIVALAGAIITYSFYGYNVIDIKTFLPAAFSWVFSIFGLYVLLSSLPTRSKSVLFSVAMGTAIYFHFYTGVAALFLMVACIGASRIPKLGAHRAIYYSLVAYPLWATTAILVIDFAGLSFNFPGAGTVDTGNRLIFDRLTLLLRGLTPAVWIIGVTASALELVFRRSTNSIAIHALLIGLLAYLTPVSGMFRVLFWPAVLASVLASKGTSDIGFKIAKNLTARRPQLSKATPAILIGCLVILATYPALVPISYTPVTYIADSSLGTIRSSYSFSEYLGSQYLSAHGPVKNFIILSDPGFSLVLGGLTGQSAVRLTSLSNMKPFQDILQQSQSFEFNQTMGSQLTKLLGQYYQISSYGGLVIALSARTYYWIGNPGTITWAPMSTTNVNGLVRTNLLDSPILQHLYNDDDVDLFFMPFGVP